MTIPVGEGNDACAAATIARGAGFGEVISNPNPTNSRAARAGQRCAFISCTSPAALPVVLSHWVKHVDEPAVSNGTP